MRRCSYGAHRPPTVVVTGLLLALACACLPAMAVADGPDFSAYVAVEADPVGNGKVAGVIRNVSGGPIRDVRMRVRHRWHWPDGGSHTCTREALVGELLLPGEIKGFAAVCAPGTGVPAGAGYDFDVTVIELVSVGLAP